MLGFWNFIYSETCVREPPSRLTLNSGWCGKSCLSYKGTCHVILLAKLHDMYLCKTTTFPHQPLRSVSKVAVLHRFYCMHGLWKISLPLFFSLLSTSSWWRKAPFLTSSNENLVSKISKEPLELGSWNFASHFEICVLMTVLCFGKLWITFSELCPISALAFCIDKSISGA